MSRIMRALVPAIALLCCMGVAVHARKGAPKNALAFPSLENCQQKPDSTPFRLAANITKGMPAQTWCFGFSTAAPTSTSAPCGNAAMLERVQLWAPYTGRTNITAIRIRDTQGERTVFGAWIKKGATYVDELVVSKLDWTAQYIQEKNPKICLTLNHAIDLDTLCLGPQGQCTVALYSLGSRGQKCCPVYTTAAPLL
ncbi:Perphorin-1 [Tetrabaena socialis]|uniref:Perphorin-1 n=1 Tax=Tetrabaena socialis TaxID=47790 RepID=A0A2J8AC47_9CHLO|nr:Perphorin-1 [Tetrabaena socialis]|eukprot:PNH10091.1 Perphorin-1 [Tetrabaena socialis]